MACLASVEACLVVARVVRPSLVVQLNSKTSKLIRTVVAKVVALSLTGNALAMDKMTRTLTLGLRERPAKTARAVRGQMAKAKTARAKEATGT